MLQHGSRDSSNAEVEFDATRQFQRASHGVAHTCPKLPQVDNLLSMALDDKADADVQRWQAITRPKGLFLESAPVQARGFSTWRVGGQHCIPACTVACEHNKKITCIYSCLFLFDVRRKDVLRADFWKATGAANMFQELCKLTHHSKKHGMHANRGEITKFGNFGDPSWHSYAFTLYAPKLNAKFVYFGSHATTKPGIGMCLKPRACTRAVALFLLAFRSPIVLS